MPALNIKKMIYACCPRPLRLHWERIEASELGYRLARGVFWSLAGTAIARGITFLGFVLVARMLGTEAYGELGVVRGTVGMFGVLAGFGLALTASKHIAQYRGTEPTRAGRMMALSASVALATGAVATAGMWACAPWLAEHLLAAPHLAKMLRVGSLILLLSAVNGAQIGALTGFEAFKTMAVVNTLVAVISLPMLLVGARVGGVDGVIWALVLNLVVGWLLNHLALRREAARAGVPLLLVGSLRDWPVLWSFSLPAVLSSALVCPVTWACSVLLVNQPQGYREMGIYGAASLFQVALAFFGTTVGAPLLPIMATTKKEDSRLAYGNILLSWAVGAIPAAVLLAFPEIMALAFGPSFAINHAGRVFVIVMLATCVSAYKRGLSRVLATENLLWWSVPSCALWAVICLTGAYLLRDWGATGLATAYAAAGILNTVVLWPLCSRRNIVPRRLLISREAGAVWGAIGILAACSLMGLGLPVRIVGVLLTLAVMAIMFRRLMPQVGHPLGGATVDKACATATAPRAA